MGTLIFHCQHDMCLPMYFDADLLRPKLKSLNGLVLHHMMKNVSIPSKLVCAFSEQLKSLHLSGEMFRDLVTNENKLLLCELKHLEELCMDRIPNDIKIIIAKAPNLKRVHLEFLSIDAMLNGFLEALMNSLINALNASHIIRKNLKMKINVCEFACGSLQIAAEYIDKISKAMSNSVSNDFLLNLVVEVLNNRLKVIEDKMKELESLCLVSYQKGNDKNIEKMIIQNKGNKMCGFEEKWIHKCCNCK